MVYWIRPSGYGGIGRRDRLRIYFERVGVQVPLSAPNKNNTNPDGKSEFVLFFTRDYFGLIVKLK